MRQIKFCPRFGDDREAPCRTIEERNGERVEKVCMFLTNLRGVHPQTGEPVDREMCMDEANMLLSMDQNKLLNEMTGSVQSYRNEASKLQTALQKVPVKQMPPDDPRMIDHADS